MNPSDRSRLTKALPRRLMFATLALCGLCCAIPVAGTILGVGAFAAMAAWFENAALALFALTLLIAVAVFVRKRRAARCSVDCRHRPEQERSSD
jgi:uncharacterized protein (DUF58 family)